MISSTLYYGCNYLHMLGIKLTLVIKSKPWWFEKLIDVHNSRLLFYVTWFLRRITTNVSTRLHLTDSGKNVSCSSNYISPLFIWFFLYSAECRQCHNFRRIRLYMPYHLYFYFAWTHFNYEKKRKYVIPGKRIWCFGYRKGRNVSLPFTNVYKFMQSSC